MAVEEIKDRYMDLRQFVSSLKRNRKVYIYDSLSGGDAEWLQCQQREKDFWSRKINKTDYNPDPKSNFISFLTHWGIGPSFFKGKKALEIGSGPFGFFSAISQIDAACLPEDLMIVDPLMDFYQRFEISEMIPEKAIRLQARGEEIPLPDRTFDIIVTTNTIDHVQNCDDFLKEAKRLLKPDGTLFFSVHAITGALGILKPLIKKMDTTHRYHLTGREINSLFKRSGFRLCSVKSIPLYKEDAVPEEVGLAKRIIYRIGFRLMDTLYGVARPGRGSGIL